MSDQQPDPAAAPPETLHSAVGSPAAKLHDDALQAEKHLESLATGLAANHADPGAVKAVGQMAEVLRKMLKMMAGQAQDEAPAAPQQHTMNSATDSLVADVQSNRAQ